MARPNDNNGYGALKDDFDSDNEMDAILDNEIDNLREAFEDVDEPCTEDDQLGWATVSYKTMTRKAKEQAQRQAEKDEERARRQAEQDAERMRRYEQREKEKELRREFMEERKNDLINTHMTSMLVCFDTVTDMSIPASELATLVIYDSESAPGYTSTGERTKTLTEMGFAVVPLIRVRKLMMQGLSLLKAFAHAMKSIHLRVHEHGKWQISRETDRHGDRLWQAAFSEFGASHWVKLKNLPKHIVDTVHYCSATERGSSKMNIIVVAHAAENDSVELSKIGFAWKDHFNVQAEVDTQILSWNFAGTTKPPGLLALMRKLGINNTRRHNGANDAVHTAFVLCAIALHHAQAYDQLQVHGNPTLEVGGVVDGLRLELYQESSTIHIHPEQACHVCGGNHLKIECNRRCLYCLRRRRFDVYHNWLDCPERAKTIQNLGDTSQGPANKPDLLNLINTQKCFRITVDEERLIATAHSSGAAKSTRRSPAAELRRGIQVVTEDPRRPLRGTEENVAYEADADDFPSLGSVASKL